MTFNILSSLFSSKKSVILPWYKMRENTAGTIDFFFSFHTVISKWREVTSTSPMTFLLQLQVRYQYCKVSYSSCPLYKKALYHSICGTFNLVMICKSISYELSIKYVHITSKVNKISHFFRRIMFRVKYIYKMYIT